MSQFFKSYILHNTWFFILSSVAVAFLTISFFMPPQGEIHPSVIAAVGEIFAFSSLGCVLKSVDKGQQARIQHGNTTVTLGDDEDERAPHRPYRPEFHTPEELDA